MLATLQHTTACTKQLDICLLFSKVLIHNITCRNAKNGERYVV